MNILVTGSTGFVGSHMLRYLKQNTDANCYGITLSTSTDNNTFTCDLSDSSAVNDIIKNIKPELLFHMAGSFTNNFDIDFKNNVLCTKNILDAIVHNKLTTRVLLMGSAAEYGEIKQEENPVSESHVLNPVSVYGWSKAAQTHLASLYASTHNVGVTVARTFNLKGKGISDKLFIGKVEKQIEDVLAGKANLITVGNTEARRDYIDIDDACPVYHTIIKHGAAGEIYNVGSGEAITIKTLLEKMLQDAGLDYSIVNEDGCGKNTPHSEVSVIYADTKKLKTL